MPRALLFFMRPASRQRAYRIPTWNKTFPEILTKVSEIFHYTVLKKLFIFSRLAVFY